MAQYPDDRLKSLQEAAERENRPIPLRLPIDASMLIVADDLIRVLDRDLLAAGLSARVRGKDRKGREAWRIEKRDERGRTFDIHAFRTTFNSLLAAAGIPLNTRRILMRHAAEGVTDEHYSDAKLIDLRGVLQKLPGLPLPRSAAAQETRRCKASVGDGCQFVTRFYLPVRFRHKPGYPLLLLAHSD